MIRLLLLFFFSAATLHAQQPTLEVHAASPTVGVGGECVLTVHVRDFPALRTYVSRLRQSFPEGIRDWVETEPSGYRLSAPAEALTHLRLGALRQEARIARDVGDPARALRLLDEALAKRDELRAFLTQDMHERAGLDDLELVLVDNGSTDGSVEMPACGFAMGDYVVRNLIEETPHAKMQMEVWLQGATSSCDVYLVIADENRKGRPR